MPVTMLNSGESGSIKKIGGQKKVKKFLESFGFVTGEEVRMVSSNGKDVIIQVKESRVAVSQGLANKIIV